MEGGGVGRRHVRRNRKVEDGASGRRPGGESEGGEAEAARAASPFEPFAREATSGVRASGRRK